MRLILTLLVLVSSACAQGVADGGQGGSGRLTDDPEEPMGPADRAGSGGGGSMFGLGDAATDAEAEDAGPARDAGIGDACEVMPEVCNGLDDDCDGAIDEEGVCPCDFAEYGGHAYLYCDEELSWPDARARCQSYGYDLAVIEDADEDAIIYAQLAARSRDDTWIGLDDRATEGIWQWVDLAPLTYVHWDEGEPNDGSGGEDCGIIMTTAGRMSEWDDRPCEGGRPFVCESTAGP